MRSKYTRRISRSLLARGDGSIPSASSRASTNASIGLLHVLAMCNLGNRRTHRRDKRPMRLVLGPLLNPAAQQRFLGRGKRLAAVGRRHRDVRVGRLDAFDERTFAGSPGTIAVAPDSSSAVAASR